MRRGYIQFMLRRAARPIALIIAIVSIWHIPSIHDPAVRAAQGALDVIKDRPAFAINRLEVRGADRDLATSIQESIDLEFPRSALRTDVHELRDRILRLPTIDSADVRIDPDKVLRVIAQPKEAIAIWKHDGIFETIDEMGSPIRSLARRSDRPDLPLLVGESAEKEARGALALWQASGDLAERIDAVVRMGRRRWSLLLSGGQIVHLPADDPQRALQMLMASHRSYEVLDREVDVFDLRARNRLVMRLTPRGERQLMDARELIAASYRTD